ncbi:hypothetical protein [Frankia sp. Cr1]|uniref:hypothetical protein n=1 Tax=Frankia sp. Cr1 TaxID=3073931 RepID=UPI002AD56BCD|nr:hypothetical protein [Frankia sp. Cr1]
MIHTETLLASAARGAGSTLDIPGRGVLRAVRAQLDVTAVSGTSPTLDLLLEETFDGASWDTVLSWTQATAATREIKTGSGLLVPRVRLRWTIGGTASPTVTFSVRWLADWTQ